MFLSCCFVFANEITEDYLDMATNYCIQGNYRAASQYLDKILLIEPNNKAIADLRKGLSLIIQGKHDSYIQSSSVKQAKQAKQNGDKNAELTALASGNDYWSGYFLGEYYKQNKDYNQAIKSYIRAVNMKPTFTQCYLQIAICYYELGNYIQTTTYLKQYLKSNPQDDFAYALNAKAHLAINNNEMALNEILTAISLENSIDYRFTEAKILFNMRKYETVVLKLESLKDDIQTAEFYKLLGLSYAELGNKSAALINLEKSILLCDNDKTVNIKYNELRN